MLSSQGPKHRRSRSTAPPSGLPAISLTGGEIGGFGAGSSSCHVEDWRRRLRQSISPLVGEMPGRAEGGAVECQRR
ncbi:MAG: propionyl-coenzyme A carboxylase alpha polypeptide [Mesorhizobium sp.]|nr:propionyl-coenzyme A carboxylase alpha polypeptide [Mesorhizobium sp. M8A.F.Ca.ET.059.01.1.1]TIT63697.1 MAG: propionyl-coenzyme A carboxylase alpha polypeptide [Mesorhizobium sp.]